jgi:hypothetical protein
MPSVLEELRRDTRPSHQPGRRKPQIRVGKRELARREAEIVARFEARIAALEQQLAAIEGAPSLKNEIAKTRDDPLEQPLQKTGGSSIVDSRRPSSDWFSEQQRREAERRERELTMYRKGLMASNLRAHGYRGGF